MIRLIQHPTQEIAATWKKMRPWLGGVPAMLRPKKAQDIHHGHHLHEIELTLINILEVHHHQEQTTAHTWS